MAARSHYAWIGTTIEVVLLLGKPPGVLARCFLEKFGGDSVGEIERNYRGYQKQLREF